MSLSLLGKTGWILKSTVRPNGAAAQAFEPDSSDVISPADCGEKRTPPLTMALIPRDFFKMAR
jgi:hypothetical protein